MSKSDKSKERVEFCALDALIAGFKVIYHHVDKKEDNFLSPGKLEESIIAEFQKIRPYIKV